MKSDAELIRDARRRPEAFRELYERHAAALHGWLRKRTGDDGLAFELTAETFAEAALSLRRFRDQANGSAKPWLFGIATNLLRRHAASKAVEARARRRLGLPRSSYAEAFDDVEEREAADRFTPALRDAMSALPDAQRDALELRVVRELSYDDVAASLRCSQLAARIRVSRALGTLAQALKGAQQ